MMNYTLLDIHAHMFTTTSAVHCKYDYSYSRQYVDLAVLLLLLQTPSRLAFFFFPHNCDAQPVRSLEQDG